jgi:sulfite exporter TauE/SafE
MMLSAMAQAHGSGTPSWYPFALGAVPLAMAVGAFALIVASGRHRVAVMGCGGLMILTGVGVLLLTMLSSPH